MLTHFEIKDLFLKYFEHNHHTIVRESSLIPPNDDKSILFTNSGMNQFKPIFFGEKETSLINVCNMQKCIRAGGKHNDFLAVGRDTYHHSLFTMAGNWSFNYDSNDSNCKSYYKELAIFYAWDFLTRVCGINKNKLYITYFAGNKDVPEDIETKELWLKTTDVISSHVLPFDKENFWEMANIGPCGPCSEIHYDFEDNRDASQLVNKDDPTVVEIWNLVFMQYNRQENGSLVLLPKKHVDTGMGFERLVCVLQNKRSNYDTDIFQPMFNEICKLCKIPYGHSNYTNIAYRIIADHLRTVIYAINDDIVPSTTYRGFILRKLLKRAILMQCMYLKSSGNILGLIAEKILDILALDDSELLSKKNSIMYIILAEIGLYGKQIWDAIPSLKKLIDKGLIISKEDYVLLTKTKNIPEELIEQFAADHDMTIIR